MQEEKRPEKVVNIHQRILGIMSDLKSITKGDKTVNGQYRFVSHDQVAAKVHPLLVKHGVTIIPHVKEMTQDGNRTRVDLQVTFFNADMPSDVLSVNYSAFAIDGGNIGKDGRVMPVGDKGPGKAISYAYKYALLKTFCLETCDDPDNDAEASYEPPVCLEFEGILPVLSEREKVKLAKFLEFSSMSLGKHIEDVKREAVKRPEDFLRHFANFTPKKAG